MSTKQVKDPSRPVIVLGDSVILYRLDVVAAWFGTPKEGVRAALDNLKVPPLFIGKSRYYALHALERALFALTRQGAPGFAFPGSSFKATGKHRPQHRNYKKDGPKTELTLEDVEKLGSAKIDAEMAHIGEITRKSFNSAVKKLAAVYGNTFLSDFKEIRRQNKKKE